MRNAGLEEAQAGIKIAKRNINNLRYTDDTTLMAEWRRTKEPLDESERGEVKSWLKAQHSENEDHGISPITSWQIDGETMETERLYFLGLQNHCRWWLQPWNYKMLAPGRKTMTNLDSILKSRDITLPTKVRLVRATVFPVVMCGCESWTIKKAECWRIDALELWYWRRLLRVPWTARRSSQSILKEISPEY